MSANNLKHRLNEATKNAMRAREKDRLAVLRMALAEFKRVEVDERIEVMTPEDWLCLTGWSSSGGNLRPNIPRQNATILPQRKSLR